MWEHGSVVAKDPFSYTFKDRPWVSITWGYEVLNYLLYLIAGKTYFLITGFHALLAAGAALCAWLSYSAITKIRSSVAWSVGFLIFLGGLLIVERRWIDRPEMATHFFGAAMIALLFMDRARSKDHSRRNVLWLIPLLQIFWVNSHGIFLAGPAIVGAFWFSKFFDDEGPFRMRDLRNRLLRWFHDPFAILFGVTLLACSLNPLGFKVYLWPVHLMDVLQSPLYQRSIPEATDALRDGIWGFDAWSLIGWGGFIAVIALHTLISNSAQSPRKKYGIGYILFTLILVKLSLSARRNISLMVIWSIPMVADYGSSIPLTLKNRFAAPAFSGLIQCGLIFAIVMNTLRPAAIGFRLGAEPAKFHYQEGAVKFFQDKNIQGRVFANVELADYVLFHIPGFEPYIDGRFAELYSAEHFQRYMNILAHPRLLEDEAKKWNIQHVALGSTNALSKNMIHQLVAMPQWRPSYYDESSVVFSRSNTGAAPRSLNELGNDAYRRIESAALTDPARFYLKLAETSFLLGENDVMKKALDRVFILEPDNGGAWNLSCLQKLALLTQTAKQIAAKGDDGLKRQIDLAESSCLEALRLNANSSVWHALGTIYLNTNRVTDAIRAFQNVVQAEPTSYEGHFMLGQAYAAKGDASLINAMRTALERAAALRPFDNQAYLSLGTIFSQLGDKTAARGYYIRAQSIAPDIMIEKAISDLEYKP